MPFFSPERRREKKRKGGGERDGAKSSYQLLLPKNPRGGERKKNDRGRSYLCLPRVEKAQKGGRRREKRKRPTGPWFLSSSSEKRGPRCASARGKGKEGGRKRERREQTSLISS